MLVTLSCEFLAVGIIAESGHVWVRNHDRFKVEATVAHISVDPQSMIRQLVLVFAMRED